MDRESFGRLFEKALDTAIRNAETKLKREVARRVTVRLFGVGHSGDLLSVQEALGAIYIDAEHFHQIIDVGIVEVGQEHCTAFVRVSPRPPVSLDATWNDPPGSSPFKQVVAEQISVVA